MKKLIVALVLLCAASVWAVDLRNEDSRRYEVKIHSGGTTHTSIEGSTTQMSVCSDCEIEVVGVGSVKASGSETVVIKNGSLEVR
ncbi:MAG: hypothetical protein MUC76_05315 [Spirochaetes bacterium]|nr:hypothetical protein [Spirochaetota bacterium]